MVLITILFILFLHPIYIQSLDGSQCADITSNLISTFCFDLKIGVCHPLLVKPTHLSLDMDLVIH